MSISNECFGIHFEEGFSRHIENWMQTGSMILKPSYNPATTNKMVTSVKVTLITSFAITCLPKIVALGCIAVSVVAYSIFAKMTNHKIHEIEIFKNVTNRIKKFVDYLSSGPARLTSSHLKFEFESIQKRLIELEAGSEKESWENKKREVGKKRDFLIKNSEFVKNNREFLTKLTDVFLKIDKMARKRMEVCKEFMFSSFTGACLISFSVNVFTRTILDPYMLTAGAVALIYAIKKLHNIITYENDIKDEVINLRLLEQTKVFKVH